MNSIFINFFDNVIEFPLDQNVVIYGDIASGKSLIGKILSGIVHESKLNVQGKLKFNTFYLDLTKKTNFLVSQFINKYYDDYEDLFKKYKIKKINQHYPLTNGQETFLNIFYHLVKCEDFDSIYLDMVETGLSLPTQMKILNDVLAINSKNHNLKVYLATNSPEIYSAAEYKNFKIFSLNDLKWIINK